MPDIFVAPATYGIMRADVGTAHGGGFAPSGYRLRLAGLPQGPQQLSVRARSTVTGTFSNVRTITVNVRRGGVIFGVSGGPTVRTMRRK